MRAPWHGLCADVGLPLQESGVADVSDPKNDAAAGCRGGEVAGRVTGCGRASGRATRGSATDQNSGTGIFKSRAKRVCGWVASEISMITAACV